jgi:hypothetical protein
MIGEEGCLVGDVRQNKTGRRRVHFEDEWTIGDAATLQLLECREGTG